MAKYLYNGIPFPPPPDYDKTAYPHAAIIKWTNKVNGAEYGYIAVQSHLVVNSGYLQVDDSADTTKSYGVFFDYLNGEWTSSEEISGVGVVDDFYIQGTPIWTEQDIYNVTVSDGVVTYGTLYLAASDPIPVTAPALDPLSLWMGWKAGNLVARQRGKKAVEEETSETVVIEWDGDNTDLEYLEAGTTPYWYYAPMYKVSDQTPTLEQLQNAKMVLGKTDDATASETYLMTESPGFTIADINDAGYLLVIGLAMTSTNYMSYVVVIRNEEFAEYLGVSTGTYFLRVEGGYYTMKLEYPVTVE